LAAAGTPDAFDFLVTMELIVILTLFVGLAGMFIVSAFGSRIGLDIEHQADRETHARTR
jgi:hypothetical protein